MYEDVGLLGIKWIFNIRIFGQKWDGMLWDGKRLQGKLTGNRNFFGGCKEEGYGSIGMDKERRQLCLASGEVLLVSCY